MVCWMADEPLRPGGRYALKHTTSTVRAVVDRVEHRLDVNTLEPDARRDRARAQRDRPRAPAHQRAAARRPVPHATADRRVHPRRRGDERHRRRGHGQVARPRRRRAGGDLRLADVDHGSATCRSRPCGRCGAGRTVPDGAPAVDRRTSRSAVRAARRVHPDADGRARRVAHRRVDRELQGGPARRPERRGAVRAGGARAAARLTGARSPPTCARCSTPGRAASSP